MFFLPFLAVIMRGQRTDNFFISITPTEKLFAKQTSLVGTIRANKREFPMPAKGVHVFTVDLNRTFQMTFICKC